MKMNINSQSISTSTQHTSGTVSTSTSSFCHKLSQAISRHTDLSLRCSAQEAQAQLLLMVEVLRDIDTERKGGHTAAADVAYLYAMTQVWFTAERNYKVRPTLYPTRPVV